MTQEISGDTPLFQLTVNQLLEILGKKDTAPAVVKIDTTVKNHVYGLSGLAKLLSCSVVTAQRIKDSGKIPFIQIGRKLIFDSDAVLSALGNKTKK